MDPFRYLFSLVALFALSSAWAWSEALLTGADGRRAEKALEAYTNNTLLVVQVEKGEWNDANPHKMVDLLPANMPFHLVAGPDVADRQMAEAAYFTSSADPTVLDYEVTGEERRYPLVGWISCCFAPFCVEFASALRACPRLIHRPTSRSASGGSCGGRDRVTFTFSSTRPPRPSAKTSTPMSVLWADYSNEITASNGRNVMALVGAVNAVGKRVPSLLDYLTEKNAFW